MATLLGDAVGSFVDPNREIEIADPEGLSLSEIVFAEVGVKLSDRRHYALRFLLHAPILQRLCPSRQTAEPVNPGRFLLLSRSLPRSYPDGMNDLHHLALGWHRDLPERIKDYLHGRGIPDELIHRHLLGWNGERIAIPIPDERGEVAFFKFARDPENPDGPKMYATPGSQAAIYGWETVMKDPPRIVICEGEFDRLVLEAHGFDAVTSTGGAGTFSPAWAPFFRPIREVFLCFDRDEAGREGALRAGRILPQSRIVDLPPEVGEAGDVTDFFVRLKKTPQDFETLLASAKEVPRYLPPDNLPRIPERRDFGNDDRIARLKREIPIATVVERFIELRPSGFNLSARCPFHTDREPSFVVFPRTNTFHCFGCRAGGDAISFLRLSMGLSFPEALDALEKFLSTP
jgi:hypothetical protein